MGAVVHLVLQAVHIPVRLCRHHECDAQGIMFLCVRRGEGRNDCVVDGGRSHASWGCTGVCLFRCCVRLREGTRVCMGEEPSCPCVYAMQGCISQCLSCYILPQYGQIFAASDVVLLIILFTLFMSSMISFCYFIRYKRLHSTVLGEGERIIFFLSKPYYFIPFGNSSAAHTLYA